MRKENNEPYPWTDDEYLRDNHFTCNRRIDDKTTKYLLKHITNNPDLEINDKFWRSLVFGLYNKIETAEAIKISDKNFWDNIYNNIEILDNLDFDPFTRAYTVRHTKYIFNKRYPDNTWKSNCLHYIYDLRMKYNGIIPKEVFVSEKDCFNWLCHIPSVGDFLGMQLMIDIMYIPGLPYDINTNTFVIAGPGATVGINFITNNHDNYSYEKILKFIKDNFEELCKQYYDPDFKYSNIKEDLNDRYAYCITDIQNLFCEFGKYMYMRNNSYKKRRKYHFNDQIVD